MDENHLTQDDGDVRLQDEVEIFARGPTTLHVNDNIQVVAPSLEAIYSNDGYVQLQTAGPTAVYFVNKAERRSRPRPTPAQGRNGFCWFLRLMAIFVLAKLLRLVLDFNAACSTAVLRLTPRFA